MNVTVKEESGSTEADGEGVDEAAGDGVACAVFCAAEDDGEAEGREEAEDAVQPVKQTAKSPDIKSLKICFLSAIFLPHLSFRSMMKKYTFSFVND